MAGTSCAGVEGCSWFLDLVAEAAEDVEASESELIEEAILLKCEKGPQSGKSRLGLQLTIPKPTLSPQRLP